MQSVADSIQAFGWRQPIVVAEDGVIILGHTRRLAAILLKLTTVPVHVATGLSKAQVKALRLADNRTHDNASWDLDLLEAEFERLRETGIDLALTAFDQAEIDRFLGTVPVVDFQEYNESAADEVVQCKCPECGLEFLP